MNRMMAAVLTTALVAGGFSSAAVAADKGKGERKICKSYAKTSSRIGIDRVCKTKAQWDADAINDAITMEKFKNENTGRPLIAGPGSQPTRRN